MKVLLQSELAMLSKSVIGQIAERIYTCEYAIWNFIRYASESISSGIVDALDDNLTALSPIRTDQKIDLNRPSSHSMMWMNRFKEKYIYISIWCRDSIR